MNSPSLITGKFEPIHDAHAIEQVQIAINFLSPLDATSMTNVRSEISAFESELPGYSEIQRLAIGVTQTPGFINGPITSTGFVRFRTAANGVVLDELIIAPESITFRTTSYTRWVDIWTKFSRYLKAILEIYVSKLAIAQVSLSFVDKFVWIGEVAACKPKLLLRPDSRYICPHIYAQDDLWHSHTGVFLRVDAYTKRLLNINVDYLDDLTTGQARRIVGISTVLTDMLNQPSYQAFNLTSGEAFDSLSTRMTALHNMSKTSFAHVISDEMCERIALVK